MTENEIREIRQRCEAATPSKWTYDGMHNEIHACDVENGAFLIVSELREHPGEKLLDKFGHTFNADFEFIAHARQDIPALLDALKEANIKADEYEKRWFEIDAAHSKTFIALCDMKKRVEAARAKCAAYENAIRMIEEMPEQNLCPFCNNYGEEEDCNCFNADCYATRFSFNFSRFSDAAVTE